SKIGDSELLFLSSKAVFDGSKPIRGGIPIVFPQFGKGPLPQHGFARNQSWIFEKLGMNSLKCTLEDNPQTFSQWPFKFRLEYLIEIIEENKLKTQLIVTNSDSKEFNFTSLLHTYF